ncbi:hypothetical protein ACIQUM_36205 [Amycolatopsis azurea]|uniref:hypothetical protein n=1 Tax=Amycolatopsis azurea TaxID=36819 RepID=UPI003829CC17
MLVSATSDYTRRNWKKIQDRARFEDEIVVVTTHDQPVAAVMSVPAWRRRATDGDLDPDAVLTRGVRDGRTKQHDMLTDARMGKATLLRFRGVEDVVIFAPIALLSDDEIAKAVAAPLDDE